MHPVAYAKYLKNQLAIERAKHTKKPCKSCGGDGLASWARERICKTDRISQYISGSDVCPSCDGCGKDVNVG